MSTRTLSPPDTADNLLFVVRAGHGRVVLDSKGNGTLTMDDIDGVTWFSDRPDRDAGVSTMRQALRAYGWERDGDDVSDDAPNATLTSPELGDAALVVELLTASADDDHASFQVRAISASGAQDLLLTDLDLFIDTTTAVDTPASAATRYPEPAAVAGSAGFGSGATLADHVRGLLVATGAGAGADSDLIVQLAVRAAFAIGAGGTRSSVPVLMATLPTGADPGDVADRIERWITTNGANIDSLVFDVTVETTDPPAPVLIVRNVELPLTNVDRPSA